MSRRMQVIRWDEKPRTESSSDGESWLPRKTRRKRVPLSKKEITCLKAVNDLSQRGFGRIKKRDIMRAATRVYPDFYRMALNENEILECLEKLKSIDYVKGYGHLRSDHQSFAITIDGKDAIRNVEQMPVMERPSHERRASRPIQRVMRPIDQFASSHQRRDQIKHDLNDLTQADAAILQVIDKLKNVRSMTKVLHNDVWRMGQREFPSHIREHTLLSTLESLIGRGYLKWVGHYTLTDKGQRAANMISRAREIS